MWEELELRYGSLVSSERLLLHQLTLLGRLITSPDYVAENEYSVPIEGIYQNIWDDLVRLRPSLIERFIEVEGIPQ